ncbi:MAG: carboxypeptidase regulatory-like domain-containing protein [Planctomycetes bacterium]|nr:carboxypeptidase regulatory-like domain-containing protein [Planctomycetota bacterium]
MYRLTLFLLSTLFCTLSLQAQDLTVSGQITFDKRIYSGSGSSFTSSTESTALSGALVEASLPTGSSQTTYTDSNGNFTIALSITSTYTLKVYSKNATIMVGNTDNISTNADLYSVTIASSTSSSGPFTKNISENENAGAFNIFQAIKEGRDWVTNLGYTLSQSTKVKWPNSDGTYYDPSNNYLYFLGGIDPDEYDDDIILHEFGHYLMESLSLDHSQGGVHYIDSQVDLRLAWSEGVASYISAAIRNDPNMIDTNYYGSSIDASKYSIADPSSAAMQTTNEWAVSYVLWQAHQDNSASDVMATLAAFQNLPSSLNGEQITMDTFNDLWEGSDLLEHYQDRSMTYWNDALADYTSTSPRTLTSSESFSKLTFYPSNDVDYFIYTSENADTLTFKTNDTGNGALTKIEFFKLSLDNKVASDNPSLYSSSQSDSQISYTLDEPGSYYFTVSRFVSNSKNYLGDSYYSQTAGRYGNYDLDVTVAKGDSFNGVYLSSDHEAYELGETISLQVSIVDLDLADGVSPALTLNGSTIDLITSQTNIYTSSYTPTSTGSYTFTANILSVDGLVRSTLVIPVSQSVIAEVDLSDAPTEAVEIAQDLDSATSISEATESLVELINSVSDDDITNLFLIFVQIVTEGASKSFTTTDGTSVTIKSVTQEDYFTTEDEDFELGLSGVPINHAIVVATLPTSYSDSVPEKAVGKVMSLDLVANSGSPVDSGFEITIRIPYTQVGTSSVALYRQGTDGSFSDSGISPTLSEGNWVFSLNSFSVYTFVDTEVIPTGTAEGSSLTSGGGGGGGGCLLY